MHQNMIGGKRKNLLWRARKARNLKQKQIARLLGYKTVDQISRYEHGTHLPSLKMAFKLEIVLGIPSRALFSGLYAEVSKEVTERLTTNPALRSCLSEFADSDFCSFVEQLRSPRLSDEKVDGIRTHAIHITRALSDWLQKNRKPSNEQTSHGE